jgi:hypothetical protein
MGRTHCQRGIRFAKPFSQGFSAWQERARANCGSTLPEYSSPAKKFLSHAGSLADITRQLRFLAAACLR